MDKGFGLEGDNLKNVYKTQKSHFIVFYATVRPKKEGKHIVRTYMMEEGVRPEKNTSP